MAWEFCVPDQYSVVGVCPGRSGRSIHRAADRQLPGHRRGAHQPGEEPAVGIGLLFASVNRGMWSNANLELRKMRNFPPSVRRHASREIMNISDLITAVLAD